MIVYSSTKHDFLKDVSERSIGDVIFNYVKEKLGRATGNSEKQSRENSLKEMYFIMTDNDIPEDSGVHIEYNIPGSSKRIDFVITGENENHEECAIIIELKQWSEIEVTDKDAVVMTYFKGGKQETNHPSYQAWSYSELLRSFNSTVYEENIGLQPCAYLHNYLDDGKIKDDFYSDYIKIAPLFLKNEKEKLRDFIKKYVKYGDKKQLMYRIDKGEIRPSKVLADSLASMLKGNQEFIMIDDQKIVYETALSMMRKSKTSNQKNILIVEGGPGTGKSVVAINLLVAITKLGMLAQYVTKNSAPRTVYQSKLTGTLKKTQISNLFTGSGSYIDCDIGQRDALIVDEAHRLNAKSGMFSNLGENQIKEIILSSKFSVFFIDEDQKVTLKDIGEKEEIIRRANKYNANVETLTLSSQFRCNGSDGYLSWLDDALQISETANYTFDRDSYDFKVFSSPEELKNIIFEKNKIKNKARLVAGYCWDWMSKKDKDSFDIKIPEHNFAMKRNLATDGNLRIVNPASVNEVGCIHTCQGLDVDYIGVIIGPDLVIRNGKVVTLPENRAKTDQSLKGYKTLIKNEPTKIELVDRIIKNTYRTLMTRGVKGCYIYCTDKETEEYFKERMKKS